MGWVRPLVPEARGELVGPGIVHWLGFDLRPFRLCPLPRFCKDQRETPGHVRKHALPVDPLHNQPRRLWVDYVATHVEWRFDDRVECVFRFLNRGLLIAVAHRHGLMAERDGVNQLA